MSRLQQVSASLVKPLGGAVCNFKGSTEHSSCPAEWSFAEVTHSTLCLRQDASNSGSGV